MPSALPVPPILISAARAGPACQRRGPCARAGQGHRHPQIGPTTVSRFVFMASLGLSVAFSATVALLQAEDKTVNGTAEANGCIDLRQISVIGAKI